MAGPALNRPLCWAAALVALLAVPVPLLQRGFRRLPGQWHTGPLTPGFHAVRAFATLGCLAAALYTIVQLVRGKGHVRHGLRLLTIFCWVSLLRDVVLFGRWSPPPTFQDQRWSLGCHIALAMLSLPAAAAGLSTYAWLLARSERAPGPTKQPGAGRAAAQPNRPFCAAVVAVVVLAALEPILSLTMEFSRWLESSLSARMALPVLAELAAVCSVGVATNLAVRLVRPNARVLATLWVLAALGWLFVLGRVGTFVSAMPWGRFGSAASRNILFDYVLLYGLGFLAPITAAGMATAAALMEWRRVREAGTPPELAGATAA